MPTAEEILAALEAAKAKPTEPSTPDPAPTVKVDAEVKELKYDELADLQKKAAAIQSQYGQLSDIPLDSAYWGYMNRIRQLLRA